MFLLSTLGFIALITMLTVVHEYAHYAIAVRHRIDVRAVSIGVGPTLWHHTNSNGTRWEIRLFPFMGGTYMAGMTVAAARSQPPRPGRRAFIYAPPSVRVRISLAGVAMNLLVTWLAFTFAALVTTVPRTHQWWAWFASPVYGLQAVGRMIRFVLDRSWGWVTGVTNDPATSATTFESFPHLQTVLGLTAFAIGAASMALAVLNIIPLWPFDGFIALVALYDLCRAFAVQGHYQLRRRPLLRPLTIRQQRWLAWPVAAIVVLLVTLPLLRGALNYVA